MDSWGGIWEIYGLRYDPFYVGPILVYGGEIPRETFTGREKEVARLKKIIRSGSSRTLLTGEPGVGKTSFANFVRAEAKDNGYFTSIKEIAVQPDWGANEFILNTLFAIYNTLKRSKQEHILSNELFKDLEILVSSIALESRSGSISAVGFGLGYSKSASGGSIQITTSYLQEMFEKIVQEILSAGNKELILHYNNLENFESSQLQDLFNKIRDFLLTEHVHFIFVGDLTVPPALHAVGRVRSIFNDTPVILENLSFEEILLILKKRVDVLTIEELSVVIPYVPEAVKILYDLYDGNIRNILNSLSTAIRELTEERAVVLDETVVCKILAKVAEERWLSKVTDWEKEVLVCILQNNEITNKEIATKIKKIPQNVSKATSKLLKLSAIYVRRKKGVNKFFAVNDSVKWFLLSDKVKNAPKTGSLLDYI